MNFSVQAPVIDTGHLIALGALAVILTSTAFTELKDHRIPNAVTIGGLALGLLIGYLPGGISFSSSFGGFLIGFGFLFLFYMFGGMGGGDVKLMGAVGALLGYPLIKTALVYTALIGGAMAFVKMIWHPPFWRRIFRLGKVHMAETEETEGEEAGLGSIPYGFAIICGCLMTIFLTGR